ncbi:hypothetical protein KD050_06630 [Psychrobacillus sp. INOP01]|uniref:hypothetical protein n=1 Tax=Psychrobacillus sp. INOP01 TaxID=2829187 RepID=UPI001BABC2DB|nr:hypothetical protein [Psychrobacillus sp. INOP01]QUG42917.1 hypothetical protein KD050_06630 [Psychrobacillus sp. INOP01]
MKILFIFLLFVVYFALSLSLESTKAIGIYLIISLGLFFWGVIEWRRIINRRNTENRTRCEELIAAIPHTQSLISENLLNAMLIDDVNNILYILQRDSLEEDFNIENIPFFQVLEVAIVEEERVLNLYPKEGLLGSTLVNNEEIMDEDSDGDEEDEEGEEEEESIEALCLKIVVDDLTKPILEYPFVEFGKLLAIDSEEYIEANSLCNEWYQKICIIIKRYEHDKVVVRLWQ